MRKIYYMYLISFCDFHKYNLDGKTYRYFYKGVLNLLLNLNKHLIFIQPVTNIPECRPYSQDVNKINSKFTAPGE